MAATLRPWAAAVLASALLVSTAHAAPSAGPVLVDSATPTSAQPAAGPAGTLVFSDEFTGSALDTAKWQVRDQERTEPDRTDGIRWWYKPANVRVIPDNGGNLAIDLRNVATNQYAGGRVDTDSVFDYTHGTLEVRIHVPPTEGHLGAVWLQTHSWGGIKGSAEDGAEIDLIESAYTGDRYAATIHYDGYGADHQQSAQVVPAAALHSTHYHTIGLNWTAWRSSFRGTPDVDDRLGHTSTSPLVARTIMPNTAIVSLVGSLSRVRDGPSRTCPCAWRTRARRRSRYGFGRDAPNTAYSSPPLCCEREFRLALWVSSLPSSVALARPRTQRGASPRAAQKTQTQLPMTSRTTTDSMSTSMLHPKFVRWSAPFSQAVRISGRLAPRGQLT